MNPTPVCRRPLVPDHRWLDRDAPADVAALQALHERAPGYSRAVHGRDPDGSEAVETLTSLPPGLSLADKSVLGFFLAGELAGAAELLRGYPEPGTVHIGLLLFAEAHQGRGLGRHALALIQDLAAGWGCTHLGLAVLDVNPRAHAFWLREGFVEVGRKAAPGYLGEAIVMARKQG